MRPPGVRDQTMGPSSRSSGDYGEGVVEDALGAESPPSVEHGLCWDLEHSPPGSFARGHHTSLMERRGTCTNGLAMWLPLEQSTGVSHHLCPVSGQQSDSVRSGQ